MRYSIGDSVYVIKTGDLKEIIDFELICDTELYYMSDLTSFPCEQLTKFKEIPSQELLQKKISDNEDVIMSLIDFEKVSKNWTDWFFKHSKKKLG
jgi:hypothetical protein